MHDAANETAVGAVPASFDVVILGAGMAGASLAAELARERKVLLLEVEDEAGRHATGRSAAMFFESYGNATVCALTRASRTFLERPPAGFAETALMTPRAALFVADAESLPRLDAMLGAPTAAPTLRRLDPAAAIAHVPILRRDRLAGAAFDDSGCDIDVAAVHQGYLRAARRAGAQLVLGAREALPVHEAGRWWCARAPMHSPPRCSSTRPAPGRMRWRARRASPRSACSPSGVRR